MPLMIHATIAMITSATIIVDKILVCAANAIIKSPLSAYLEAAFTLETVLALSDVLSL